MHKSLLLSFYIFLVLFLASSLVVAQEQDSWSFEPVTFPSGKKERFLISYDSFNERLYFKNEKGEENHFLAEEVVSFEYMGSRYYSLPFEGGAFSFFEVEFEGESTALVSKPNSLNLMQYLAKRYDKVYTVCEGFEGGNELQLCKISYTIAGFGPLNLTRILPANPAPRKLLDKYLEPVQIRKCLFVVGEEGIEIFQLNVDQDVLMGLFIRDKKYAFESLEDFFGRKNYQKMHSYARKNKLKEHQLEDLKMLFEYYDNI